jgi:hypothetical protein
MSVLVNNLVERLSERNGDTGVTLGGPAPKDLSAMKDLSALMNPAARVDAPARRAAQTADKAAALQVAPDSSPNDDIFTPKFRTSPEYDYAPRMIYFYYVSVNDNGSLRVSHYEYHEDDPEFADDPVLKWKEIPRNRPELEKICLKLAINARERGSSPPETGRNFKRVRWTRVSYIMAFFDEPHWNLYRKPSDGSCVVFLTRKGSTDFIPNHSFYDAMDLEVPFSPTDIRSAVAFINHLKRDDMGTTLGYDGTTETQDFQFNLLLNVNFDDGTSSPMDIIIDPGGTNQGPPEIP